MTRPVFVTDDSPCCSRRTGFDIQKAEQRSYVVCLGCKAVFTTGDIVHAIASISVVP